MNGAVLVAQTVVMMAAPPAVRRRVAPPRPYIGQPWKRHDWAQLGNHRRADCHGTLRWSDVAGPIPLAECDQCGFELAVKR